MSDKPKFGILPKVEPSNRTILLKAIADMKKNLDLQAEVNELLAKSKKYTYDAYIKQGFTKEQAMELIK